MITDYTPPPEYSSSVAMFFVRLAAAQVDTSMQATHVWMHQENHGYSISPIPKDDNFVQAPFSDAEIHALNRWQDCMWVHPFTCPEGHILKAMYSTRMWGCVRCNYIQGWAHAFMLNPPPDPMKAYVGVGE